jgi:hypothetical protein
LGLPSTSLKTASLSNGGPRIKDVARCNSERSEESIEKVYREATSDFSILPL